MKRLNQLFTTAALVAATFAAPTQAQQQAIDLKAVNVVIAEVLNDLIKDDTLVGSLVLRVDENSNLDEGNVGVAVAAALKTSVWAPGQAVTVEASARSVKKLEHASYVGLDLGVDARVGTDILALTRWFATKQLGQAEQNGENERLKNIFKNLSVADSLDDLYTAAVEMKAYLIDEEDDAEFAKAVTITNTVETNGAQTVAAVWKGESELFDKMLVIREVAVTAQANGIVISAKLDSLVEKADFAQYVATIKDTFRGLQARNADLIESLKEFGAGFLDFAKDTVGGT